MKYSKNIFKIFIGLFLIFNFNACSDSGDPVIPDTPRTADDVREDFISLNISSGTSDHVLESTIDNVFWSFRTIVPEVASDSNKRPLIIRLHGGAQNVSENSHTSTSCLVEPGFEGMDAIIISPNSKGSLWFDQANQVQVLALVDLAKTYLPVDINKVVIMGYSDGGNGAWFYSQYYPDLFSAGIPMASSYDTETGNGVEAIDIPLYVIHGSDDELFPIETTEEFVNESIAAGSDIQFITADGLTHYNSCDYVSYLQNAATWLTTTVWN
ncbi:carboxylesterase family protein [Urechidicola croceus]|nr:dienelactone hydrolase family protein [Urechidicola croceus]